MRYLSLVLVVALLGAACGDSAVDPERLCEIFAELGEDDTGPPDQASVARERDLLKEAKKVAPDEIRSSVELGADANLALLDLVEEAEFDLGQVDETAFNAFFTEEVIAAGESIEAWDSANCST